jgi:hypothetical protein
MLTYADVCIYATEGRRRSGVDGRRYSFYLLYWYTSTNTDTEKRAGGGVLVELVDREAECEGMLTYADEC